MALSRIVNSNTDSIECYGCGKVITEDEAIEYLIRPRNAGGTSLESGNVLKLCKECKNCDDVSVNVTFKLWQAKKMRQDFSLPDPNNPTSAKGLAGYIKVAVHRHLSRFKDSTTRDDGEGLNRWTPQITHSITVKDSELEGLDKEVRNLRRSLNRNIEKQVRKMMEELTEPLNSRLVDLDELIRARKEMQAASIKKLNEVAFEGNAEITHEAFDEN